MFITKKKHKRIIERMAEKEEKLQNKIIKLVAEKIVSKEENKLLAELLEMNDQTEKNLLGEIENLNAYIVKLEECSTDDLVDHLVDRRLSKAYDDLEIANKLEELEE